jgi:hypothetical protein
LMLLRNSVGNNAPNVAKLARRMREDNQSAGSAG